MQVRAFDHIVLNVHDVERSSDWYQRVLGMIPLITDPTDGAAARTSLHFGRNKINLRPVTTSQEEWFTARRPCAGSDDLCFLIDLPPDDVVRHLARCQVAIEAGPVDKTGALGTIRSVYIRDPDGNLVELASYPGDGRGEPGSGGAERS